VSNKPVIVLGNSSKRFSGVTSTMLQVLAFQKELAEVYVLGGSYIPQDIKTINFREFLKLCSEQEAIAFHARRNDEMIQAVIAKKLLGKKNLKIIFTSTAQRHHSKFTRWLMRQMDSVITTCDQAAQYITAVPVDAIIPHGVNTQQYHPSPNLTEETAIFSKKFPTYQPKYSIAVFGRIRSSKGIDLAVQAAINVFPRHPEWGIFFCGECLEKDHEFQQSLEKQIEEAGLSDRIYFAGSQDSEDVRLIMRCQNLVIASSRNEGYGLTPLEAMSSGIPVLTSQAGVWESVVKPEFGSIFKTGDANDLASKLDALISHPEQLKKMGEAARQEALAHYQAEAES